jgi:hypothetical protein
MEPVEILAGGFDQYSAVPGKMTGKGTLHFNVNPAVGGTVLPQWGKVLQGSCDFATAHTDNGTAPGVFKMTPISTPTDAGELWQYEGDAAASAALLAKFYNIKGSWKITANANKPLTIEYSLLGAFYQQSDATQPAASDLAAAKNRETSYALKNATLSLHGSTAWKPLSFTLEGGEQTVNRDDIAEAGGAGSTDITDRKIKGSMKIYATTKATKDALGAVLAQTEGALSIAFGDSVTGKKITIGGAYMQITESTLSDENGITCFDLKFQMNRNDFYIQLN